MAAMFKLTLLMILAAVCFLPQNGVDARILCHCAGECLLDGGIPSKGCTGGPELCVTKLSAGQSSVDAHRDCANREDDERALRLKNGCIVLFPNRICVCDTDNCNDKPIFAPTPPPATATEGRGGSGNSPCNSGRLRGWSSSVLNGISVLVLVIPVPFLGRP